MQPPRLVMLVWVGILAATCAVSQAGPLLNDPNAIAGYTGARSFSSLDFDATVQYAAYAPGQFNVTFGSGADPSGGARYVYAYQIINDGTDPNVIDFLSVGLASGTPFQDLGILAMAYGNYGADPAAWAPAPTGGPYTSLTWDYTSVPLGNGAVSEILLFTSPYSPTNRLSSLQGNGGVSSRQLPSPVPEPGAIAAVGGLLAYCCRRSRRA